MVYGGLGRVVHALAEAQAQAGDDVVVLTQAGDSDGVDERINGVRVVRVPPGHPYGPLTTDTLLEWVAALERDLVAGGLHLTQTWQPDVVHGHDWPVTHSSTAVAHRVQAPLIVTVHATESGRHQGWLPGPLSHTIHDTEIRLTRAAERVITCSEYMGSEVSRLFGVSAERVDVIPNGIHLSEWTLPAGRAASARAGIPGGDGPLVVYSGRLEWEKGVQTLIDAVPMLVRSQPDVRIVVAGRGGQSEALTAQVSRGGLDDRVTFTGWLPEETLHAVVAAADVAVVPSLYEPFGLVALEAAALGTPVVVAATGGLPEFVRDGVTGLLFPPGDPGALAEVLIRALADPDLSAQRADRARADLATTYSWAQIAQQTEQTYRRSRLNLLGAAALPPEAHRLPGPAVDGPPAEDQAPALQS